MRADNLLWVLGHRIRPFDTEADYGMIEVTSPPHVPGPPPHFHESEHEFFLIVRGALDVLADGEWRRYGPGAFVDLPPHTTHTFINNTDADVVWVTGWRPKGFERFFRAFGIPVDEPDAQARSTSEAVLERVAQDAQRLGMHLVRQP